MSEVDGKSGFTHTSFLAGNSDIDHVASGMMEMKIARLSCGESLFFEEIQGTVITKPTEGFSL